MEMTGGMSQSSAEANESPPVAIADEVLLQRLRDGEAQSGEELVRRHCQALMRYLYRLSGSEHLAEELHQQTWTSVLDHIDRFDAKSSSGGFKAWLFRIATNKANDYWRSAGREKIGKEGLRLVTEEALPPADQRMEAADQERKLAQAIRQLPDQQRQVLLLRYYSDLKFAQIAE